MNGELVTANGTVIKTFPQDPLCHDDKGRATMRRVTSSLDLIDIMTVSELLQACGLEAGLDTPSPSKQGTTLRESGFYIYLEIEYKQHTRRAEASGAVTYQYKPWAIMQIKSKVLRDLGSGGYSQ
jgi:hypothetical protein